MEPYEREFFISRIACGYLRYKLNNCNVLYIRNPSLETRYIAQEIYTDTYREAILEGIMDDEDVYNLLLDNDLWTEQNQKDLDIELPKHVDTWKIELYKAAYQSNELNRIRRYLSVAKGEMARLHGIRHSYDYITCHGVATYARWQYIIENSTFFQNGLPFDWSSADIFAVLNFYHEQSIADEKVRELSHTEPWRSIWSSRQSALSLFSGNAVDFTDDQKRLIMWSSMYDNIMESPDCPNDMILNDDDMLDGWLLIQRQERDDEKKKKVAAGDKFSHNEKIANSGEIFIMADTLEDAKNIDGKNTNFGRRTKNQRIQQVKKLGEVGEENLTDVRQKIMMEAQQMYGNTIKGRG